jgi:Na+-driven multidrug efflux pump
MNVNMKKYIGNKEFYKMVLVLLIPMVIQQGVTNFVNLLDNIMVVSLPLSFILSRYTNINIITVYFIVLSSEIIKAIKSNNRNLPAKIRNMGKKYN